MIEKPQEQPHVPEMSAEQANEARKVAMDEAEQAAQEGDEARRRIAMDRARDLLILSQEKTEKEKK